MREIKFRFWNGKNMIYKNLFDIAKNLSYLNQPMQYTGIKDKNGKEIYEWDIVDCEDFVGKIEFDLSFCAFIITDGYEIKTFLDVGNQIEVLGNIYEHPHLLESQNA